MMKQRGDFEVVFEPFDKSYFLGAERLSHRAVGESPQPEYNYRVEKFAAEGGKGDALYQRYSDTLPPHHGIPAFPGILPA